MTGLARWMVAMIGVIAMQVAFAPSWIAHAADHQATAAELKTPHRLLSEQLHDETEESEAHGRHVGRPEMPVRQWADRLDFDID